MGINSNSVETDEISLKTNYPARYHSFNKYPFKGGFLSHGRATFHTHMQY